MDLTTLERVYMLDGQLPDNKDKDMVKLIISAVSSIVEAYLGRYVEVATRTESFDVPQWSDFTAWVKGYPVNMQEPLVEADPLAVPPTPEIPNPLAFDDNGTTVLKSAMNINPLTGVMYPVDSVDYGLSKFSITYNGGMATSTADFATKYPDIEYEVIKQVIFEYKRKKMMTQLSTGAGGNSSETYAPFVLQPSLQKVLRRHRRVSIG